MKGGTAPLPVRARPGFRRHRTLRAAQARGPLRALELRDRLSARRPSKTAARLAPTLAVAAVVAGCVLGPNYQRPPVAAPEQYYGQTAAASASLADLPWWQVFQDPALRVLVTEALRNGYDARLAAARVEEARARFGIAGAPLYPQVGYQGSYARERLSQFQTLSPKGVATDLFTANLNLSWEVDLWGRVHRLTEAAKAQYLASEEARRGVLLTLLSEVATAYFDLRQLDVDLEIARRTTADFQDTYDLFKRRLEGGAASGLETSNALAQLSSEASQVPLLESQIVAKENQLSLLLGRGPGTIARGTPLAGQPVPPEIPAGLPSALLQRRPDLLQAEQQMIAANANIGAARAAFFPTISLTGMLGGLSPELSRLFSEGKSWSLGAGVTGPIFQGGSLRGQLRVATAQWEEAKLQYEQAVSNAFGEVSTSLTSLQKLAEAERQREQGVNAYREAVRLARLRYVSGLSAYFEVIDAQQNLLGAENGLAQTRHDRLVALVQFYRALGGGWPLEEGPGN